MVLKVLSNLNDSVILTFNHDITGKPLVKYYVTFWKWENHWWNIVTFWKLLSGYDHIILHQIAAMLSSKACFSKRYRSLNSFLCMYFSLCCLEIDHSSFYVLLTYWSKIKIISDWSLSCFHSDLIFFFLIGWFSYWNLQIQKPASGACNEIMVAAFACQLSTAENGTG